MARLSEPHKRYVVIRLGHFRTPTEIVEEVKELFGLELTRQQVFYYDPTAPSSKTPKKWAKLFGEARDEYLAAEATVGIAHERYRLEQLQELYRRAKTAGRAGNIPLAAQLLEQAAKERGGVFTNRHKLEHSGQVQTTGVLLLPGQPALKDWGKAAREQQEQLDREAAAIAEARSGAGS